MSNLNRWEGIGRLGQDIEMRYLPNGNAVANFSIAVDDSYKSKETGQKVEQTEWVRCVAFGKSAEFLGEWLRKGARLYASVGSCWRQIPRGRPVFPYHLPFGVPTDILYKYPGRLCRLIAAASPRQRVRHNRGWTSHSLCRA